MIKRSHYLSAAAGFTLLPVVLAMGLVGSIAFMLNLDNAVNANWIGAQSDRVRARYAAEAGLQAVNYTIQGLGCGGTYPISISPVTDSNFGGAAYLAYANNTTGSPLTLTATGTYNGASVTLTKANAYVYRSGIWFVELQPGPGSGKDAEVRGQGGDATKNYGGEEDMEVKNGNEKQALIAFDLSVIPTGARVIRWYQSGSLQPGAVMSLYQQDSNPKKNISVMLITHDWVAGTRTGSAPTAGSPGVTWNRWDGLSPNTWPQGVGNGYDSRPLAVVTEPAGAGWVYIDVTDAAFGWENGVYPNYGVWLVGATDTDHYKFTSSDENDLLQTWKRPKLTVYFLRPC